VSFKSIVDVLIELEAFKLPLIPKESDKIETVPEPL
jgi:hypothetical protein